MNIDMAKLKELKSGYRNYGYEPSDLEVATAYWHSYLTNEEKVRILGKTTPRDKKAMERYHECIEEIANKLIQ